MFDLLQIILSELESNRHIQNTDELSNNYKFSPPVDIMKFALDECAELVHIKWISQHYRVIRVLRVT